MSTMLAACDRPPSAAGTAAAAVADTARADSTALANLPPALAAEFAVQTVLTTRALRDTAAVQCERMSAPNADESRRRLHARLADSSWTVLFARATHAGAMRRVELVRRTYRGGQRGFIWEAKSDVVQSVEWRAGQARPEITTLPRGEPTARALRALGRRLFALPCTGSTAPQSPRVQNGRTRAQS